MSLYLSEWKFGYEKFMYFAERAWNPCVECVLDEEDNTKVRSAIMLLDTDEVQELAETLDGDLRRQFISRFTTSTNIILEKIDIRNFIYINFNYALKLIGDVEKANESLNLALQQMIMEFEFWNKTSIVEIYSNLIFYGMLSDPKPVYFAIPAMSEWDTKYRFGWPGFPFSEFEDDEDEDY